MDGTLFIEAINIAIGVFLRAHGYPSGHGGGYLHSKRVQHQLAAPCSSFSLPKVGVSDVAFASVFSCVVGEHHFVAFFSNAA